MTTATGILFNDPQAKPLSTVGLPQAGAYLLFFLTGTTTPTNVYADGLLTTPLSQAPGTAQPSCTADSAGRFNQIYLNPGIIYRVQMFNALGVKLEDTDPYVPASPAFPSFPSDPAGITINTSYDVGNALRYGLVPNSPGAATNNTTFLKAVASPSGAFSGRFWFPNETGADTYYFNDMIQFHDGMSLDLQGCTLSFSKTGVNSDSQNSFIFALRNFKIENGTIAIPSYTISGSFVAGAALGFGARDAPVSGSPLPTIFDSLLASPMGGITVRNITINSQVVGGYGMYMLGGFRNCVFENIRVQGNGALANGFYAEFGWATSGSTPQRQTSHPHDMRFINWSVENLQAGANSLGIQTNGAYGITIDGLEVAVTNGTTAGGPCAFGPGEALFFNPWVGQDDYGTVAPNGRWIILRNIKGRNLAGTAINVTGIATATNVNGVAAWQPNTAYSIGNVVYNGSSKFTCASNGTSNASGSGPTGTGSGIVDGSTSWNYTAAFSSNGFLGWIPNNVYNINDIAFNGQYYYICTTGGTSGATQGPIGTGTNIADGSTVKWSSVGNAWPHESNLLNVEIDGFTLDGVAGAGGFGIRSSAGITNIRNGNVTNFQRGIVTENECTQWSIENVNAINNSSFNIQIGLSNQVYTPSRFSKGDVRRGFYAGAGTNGSNSAAIAMGNIASSTIENNIFGHLAAYDGLTESTQLQAVTLDTTCNNVQCKKNTVNATTSGAVAYNQTGVSSSQGCSIEEPLGAVQTYTAWWDGVLQTATLTLTCGTPGNLVVVTNPTTVKMDWIRKNGILTFSFEIVTTTFTWTTSSGNVNINGLPYPVNNALNSVPIGAVQIQGVTKNNYTQFNLTASGGGSLFNIGCSGSGQNTVTAQIADFPTAGTVKIFAAGQYFT